MTMTDKNLRDLRGLCATVCTTGHVQPEFSKSREDMRCYNIERDFTAVEYQIFDAKLVEQGRDTAVKHALKHDYDWILQIDADAVFPANAMIRILKTAYVDVPNSDAVGAYANLKNEPYLPTIDTGTGTWERWHPNSGVVPAIRTGGHFLLTKASAFHKMGPPPWFRTRLANRPVDALADTDNFARMKLDGRNPLTQHPDWHTLVAEARDESGEGQSGVGEDSSFCDRLRAAGGRLYVDTGIVTGHKSGKVITPKDFKEAMNEQDELRRNLCGIRE